MTATPKRTESQSGPARPTDESEGRERFVVAFPTVRAPNRGALPVPLPGDPLGRDWLKKYGGIDDGKASAAHPVLKRAGGVLKIEDAGSKNGTWVNGVPIWQAGPVDVADGAVIRIGNTLLIFRKRFRAPDDVPSKSLGESIGPWGLWDVEDRLRRIVDRARPPINILILGETGTGKEALAKEVATRFGKADNYARVNLTVGDTLLESSLFGHKKGAFTGAATDSVGVLVARKGGAVLLDEIGEMPPSLQPKLLRFLDEGREVHPLGEVEAKRVEVIVIAATNKPLEADSWRADLLARFKHRLKLPPLRDRREDIFAIVECLCDKRGQRLRDGKIEVEAVERILLHPWESNVRELDAKLEEIEARDPAPGLRLRSVEVILGPAPASTGVVTRAIAEQTLKEHDNNISAAARHLKMERAKFKRRLED